MIILVFAILELDFISIYSFWIKKIMISILSKYLAKFDHFGQKIKRPRKNGYKRDGLAK